MTTETRYVIQRDSGIGMDYLALTPRADPFHDGTVWTVNLQRAHRFDSQADTQSLAAALCIAGSWRVRPVVCETRWVLVDEGTEA